MYRVLVGVLAAIFSSAANAEVVHVHTGTLLAIPGTEPANEQTVIVEDGAILAVVDGYRTQGADRVIDLKDRFVMPGLMDMHVHLQSELGPQRFAQALQFTDADFAFQGAYYARKTLMAGFTTVRNVGARRRDGMYALRDAVERGWVDGPRIVAAGGVAVTGGHADTSGVSAQLLDFYADRSRTVCDGPFDCRRATRQAIKYGADLIKITSTGGVMSDTNTGTEQQMTDEELREVVQTAHSLGRKVAAHAHGANGINAALRAGVDSIEHGTYTNDESVRLFVETGAYLVPTLVAGEAVVDIATNNDFLSPEVREKALRVGRVMKENLGRAIRGGVKIAFGTDNGVSPHGRNAREAELMFEAGMAPADILVSATISAADLIDRDDLGTLESGHRADLIATTTSPLEDIRALYDVVFVMKDGVVYKETR